jgi:hypothetical protein
MPQGCFAPEPYFFLNQKRNLKTELQDASDEHAYRQAHDPGRLGRGKPGKKKNGPDHGDVEHRGSQCRGGEVANHIQYPHTHGHQADEQDIGHHQAGEAADTFPDRP